MSVSLRSKNLNLVPILQALLKEESVSRAAEELSLTQSTVSGALARLRDIYGDPLLIRVGRGSQLTPRAKKLKEQVDAVCSELQKIFEPEKFDPATAEDYFCIAAPDYLVFIINRVLLKRMSNEAPKIKVNFVNVPRDLPEAIMDRSVDFAVCGDFEAWPELEREALFDDRMVVAVADEHPLLQKRDLRDADFWDYPTLHFNSGYHHHSTNKTPKPGDLDVMSAWGWEPQISAGQFTDSLLVAADSEAIAIVPNSLFHHVGEKLDLKKLELKEQDVTFKTSIFKPAGQEFTAGNQWLYQVIKDCFLE